jgi:hypothetical protein
MLERRLAARSFQVNSEEVHNARADCGLLCYIVHDQRPVSASVVRASHAQERLLPGLSQKE